VPAPRARLVERGQDFAGEAIVADAGDRALDTPFVTGRPHARAVDVKVPRLRVLEKRGAMRAASGSALMTMALVLSGMRTLKFPPKTPRRLHTRRSHGPWTPRRWDRRSGGASARP
jgi:hypothetical protein